VDGKRRPSMTWAALQCHAMSHVYGVRAGSGVPFKRSVPYTLPDFEVASGVLYFLRSAIVSVGWMRTVTTAPFT
jgi:hypothetical protein